MSVSGVGSLQNQQQWPTFQSVDTNDDDQLSLQEFESAGQNLPGGIGSLDSSSIQSLFSAVDSDGNGQISRGEATSAFNKLSNALQSTLLGTQEQAGPPSPAQMFASADTDGSGGLSLGEFEADVTSHVPDGVSAPTDDQMQAIFNKIDANGDGQISQSEMQAAHKGHHHHGHRGPPPSDQSTSNSDAIFGPDPFSTDPTASADAASTSATQATDLNSLLLQAMSAYNANPGSTTSTDLVNQLMTTLQAV